MKWQFCIPVKGPINPKTIHSTKKFNIPQGELEPSVRSNRGLLDTVATQAHGFVEGQTGIRGNTSKQLTEAGPKTTKKSKNDSKLVKSKKLRF